MNHNRLPKLKKISERIEVVMESCWHFDPEKRPDFLTLNQKISAIPIIEIEYPHNLISTKPYLTSSVLQVNPQNMKSEEQQSQTPSVTPNKMEIAEDFQI